MEAQAFLSELIHNGAKVIYPRPGFGERLIQMAADLDITGIRIFDFQIAVTAQEGGADEIWTHDQRFITVPGLRVFDPL